MIHRHITRSLALLCFLLLLTGSATVGQVILRQKDSVTVNAIEATVTPRLTYFRRTASATRDSIPTNQLASVQLPAGLTYLIFPVQQVSTAPVLSTAAFLQAMKARDWRQLWQASTNWPLLTFQLVGGRYRFSAFTKERLLGLAQAMRAAPMAKLSLDSYTTARTNELRQQQVALLKTYLISQGIPASQFTLNGHPENNSRTIKLSTEWRLNVRLVSIRDVSVVYAEAYVPVQTAVSPSASRTDITTPVSQSQPSYTGDENPQTKRRAYQRSVLLYGTLSNVLVAQSASWVDPRAGAGLDKGVGGGLMLQWLISRRVGLGLTADYSQWLVERRYFDQDVQQFSSDQTLRRAALLFHMRFYTRGNIYIQPMGGWQVMQLTQRFSADFPAGTSPQTLWTNRPAIGGALGYELRGSTLNAGRWLLDIGLHYQLTPNQSWRDLSGPLHYVGFRAGLGWASKPPRL